MSTLSWRNAIAGLIGSALLLTVGAPAVMAAPRPLTVNVAVGDSCVSGTARKNSFVKVVVRDAAGSKILREVSDTGPSGDWQVCGYGYPILTGARVRATVFETGQSRQFTVPKLTIATDRVSEVVSGKAPAGSTVSLEVSTAGASMVGLPEYDFVQDVVASGSGTYSHDFSGDGIDLIGGTLATATWRSAGGAINVWRQTYVPGLAVVIGEAQFSGVFKPNAHLGIVVSHNSSEVATGDAVADPFYGGQISGQFVDADTEPYAIQPGDEIDAPGLGSDGTFTVPDIAGSATLATDQVSGTCFGGGLYGVYVIGPQYEFGFDFGMAAPNGSFTADLSSQLNIKKGFSVEIACYRTNGDIVVQVFKAH
jgi:hypothetical protein